MTLNTAEEKRKALLGLVKRTAALARNTLREVSDQDLQVIFSEGVFFPGEKGIVVVAAFANRGTRAEQVIGAALTVGNNGYRIEPAAAPPELNIDNMKYLDSEFLVRVDADEAVIAPLFFPADRVFGLLTQALSLLDQAGVAIEFQTLRPNIVSKTFGVTHIVTFLKGLQ